MRMSVMCLTYSGLYSGLPKEWYNPRGQQMTLQLGMRKCIANLGKPDLSFLLRRVQKILQPNRRRH